MAICPSCGRGTLPPIIRSKPIMIIKESLTNNEIEQDILFTLSGKNKYGHSENTTSYYLMKELGRVGLNLNSMSLSCFYIHTLPKAKRTKDDKAIIQKCVDFSISEVIKVAREMKIVMLMGAELVRTFTGYGVSDVAGLICKSQYLPLVPVIIPAPNPDKLMAMPIGELRNALGVFAEQVKIYEQYSRV